MFINMYLYFLYNSQNRQNKYEPTGLDFSTMHNMTLYIIYMDLVFKWLRR
jgi:hypothetical protein